MTTDNQEFIKNEMCRFLSDMIGQSISPADDLRSKGVDSVALLELVIFVERELKIPFPLELLTSAPLSSVSALASLLDSLPQTTHSETAAREK